MTSSANTATPKSKPPAAQYVSTVHDIASYTTLSNHENSSNVFVRGKTFYFSKTGIHKIFHQTFRVSTIEKNKNIQIVSHTNKGGNNKLNNNNKTPIKNVCKVMFIHTMESGNHFLKTFQQYKSSVHQFALCPYTRHSHNFIQKGQKCSQLSVQTF
jgi:hypothetical protein